MNLKIDHTGKVCPYCGRNSVFVDSKEVFSESHGMIYLCRSCQAWVGVHKGTDKALGRLANSDLRKWKSLAHYYFDKLWMLKIEQGYKKSLARGKAYVWLSEQLGLSRKETHIGWFDIDNCKKVIKICKPLVEKLKI